MANSYGRERWRCTPSLPSIPLGTARSCPPPSSSSTIMTSGDRHVTRRRLITDPQLRLKVAIAVGRQDTSRQSLRKAGRGSRIYRGHDADRLARQECRRAGRGWSRDAQTEGKLEAATEVIHAAWQRPKLDVNDAQVRRTVRHESS